MPILDFYKSIFLPQKIASITTLNSRNFAFVQRINLELGQSWICKKLAKTSWLGVRERKDLDYSEHLSSIVATELGISSAACKITDSYTVSFQGEMFLFIPYCEGEVLTNWSDQQAYILGRKLADIHQLELPNTNAKPFPEIDLPKLYPDLYDELIKICNQNLFYQSDKWVVSHRDIHHENVVWTSQNHPVLIDWESSGYIHPFIELIGLAVNCANVQQGKFDENLFIAAISGYCLQQQYLPPADDILWQLCFHSWLLWISYCLQKGWDKEVRAIEVAIRVLSRNLSHMKDLYKLVQENSYKS